MAWFGEKKDGDPKAEEQSHAQMDELVTKLRTSFQEDLKPLQAKIDSYETKFAELDQKVTKPAPKIEQQETPSVLDNEDAAFNQRMAPIAYQTALLNARMTESEILNEVASKGWGEFIPEIRKVLDQTNIQTKALDTYAGYVRNVASMIVGQKAMDGGLKRDPERKTFFIEDGSGGSTSETSVQRKMMEEASDGKIDILGRSGNDPLRFLRDKLGIENAEKGLRDN
jgi:hypothetical protein